MLALWKKFLFVKIGKFGVPQFHGFAKGLHETLKSILNSA